MVIFYIICILLSIGSGFFILWQIPLIQTPLGKQRKGKKLSLIIPARNEEKNLPVLLDSLKKQSLQPYEIIVVDDDSEDNTAATAEKGGAQVVPFPEGETNWAGKAAACYYGAKAASGEWLFFLDADVYFAKSTSLEAVIAVFSRLQTPGILSIQPYHVINEVYENLSFVFNLLVLAGMNRFSLLKKKLEPAGAFGPSLLIERKAYFEKGGHKRVRGSIMENIDLGKALFEEGVPLELYGGKGVLHFRMYPQGLGQLAEGWSKSFASGSKATHPLILIGTGLWIAGAFVTLLFIPYALFLGDFSLILLSLSGYMLYYAHLLIIGRAAGNFHRGVLLFYPLLFLSFVLLFGWSLIQTHLLKRVSWKGRKINLKENENGD